MMVPQLLSTLGEREYLMSLIDYEFKNRVIRLTGEINDQMSDLILAKLYYLDAQSHETIYMYINSPGGRVSDGMAIYDAMKFGVHSPVATIATGMAASMGAFLLAGGTKGLRYATPSAEIMIHQPLGGVSGQATDISFAAKHIQHVKKRQADMLAQVCGQSTKKVLKDMERDFWMNAQEGLKYGIIDKIGDPMYESQDLSVNFTDHLQKEDNPFIFKTRDMDQNLDEAGEDE